jgi:hypothetical protein
VERAQNGIGGEKDVERRGPLAGNLGGEHLHCGFRIRSRPLIMAIPRRPVCRSGNPSAANLGGPGAAERRGASAVSAGLGTGRGPAA